MWNNDQGPDTIYGYHLTSIGNPIVEIRQFYDRLISTMGFPILVRRDLYTELGPNFLAIRVNILRWTQNGCFIARGILQLTFSVEIVLPSTFH